MRFKLQFISKHDISIFSISNRATYLLQVNFTKILIKYINKILFILIGLRVVNLKSNISYPILLEYSIAHSKCSLALSFTQRRILLFFLKYL